MTGHELLADIVMLIHAAFAMFIVVGWVAAFTGLLLGWAWVRQRSLSSIHLLATLFVVSRVWLGLPCPLSSLEDQLRMKADGGCPISPRLHEVSHGIAFRGTPSESFAADSTLFGLLVVITYLAGRSVRRSPQAS